MCSHRRRGSPRLLGYRFCSTRPTTDQHHHLLLQTVATTTESAAKKMGGGGASYAASRRRKAEAEAAAAVAATNAPKRPRSAARKSTASMTALSNITNFSTKQEARARPATKRTLSSPQKAATGRTNRNRVEKEEAEEEGVCQGCVRYQGCIPTATRGRGAVHFAGGCQDHGASRQARGHDRCHAQEEVGAGDQHAPLRDPV